MSLRQRLALGFLLFSALPLAGFAIFSYTGSRAARAAAARAEADDRAARLRAVEDRIDEHRRLEGEIRSGREREPDLLRQVQQCDAALAQVTARQDQVDRLDRAAQAAEATARAAAAAQAAALKEKLGY